VSETVISMCQKIGLGLSVGQSAVLKSLYGLEMTPAEFDIFHAGTAMDFPPTEPQRDFTLLCGRRSGKTTRILSPVAAFECCFRERDLPKMEEFHAVTIVAPTEDQSVVCYRAILELCNSRKLLRGMIEEIKDSVAEHSLRFKNHRMVRVLAANSKTLRGWSSIALLFDEACYFAETGPQSLESCVKAALPGLLNSGGPLILSSSTDEARRVGLAYENYRDRAESGKVVWGVDTEVLNPASIKSIRQWGQLASRTARKLWSGDQFRFGFKDSEKSLLDSAKIDKATAFGHSDFAPSLGNRYVLALDPSPSGRDYFAACIAHTDKQARKIVVDWAWQTRKEPGELLDVDGVNTLILSIARMFWVNKAFGDQFALPFQSRYKAQGIELVRVKTQGPDGAQMFGRLRALLQEERLILPDEPELNRQLKSLEENFHDGRTKIESRSGHDDLAMACAVAVFQLAIADHDWLTETPDGGEYNGPIVISVGGRPTSTDADRQDIKAPGGYRGLGPDRIWEKL